jgi:hypothetical protein
MPNMQVKLFLFFAVLLFAAKPFIGFSAYRHMPLASKSIIVKAFTKRKQEYIEDGEFDTHSIIKRLADPLNELVLLFSSLLAVIFPLVLSIGKNITTRTLADIQFGLFPPQQLYLLSGKLTI